MSEDLIKRLLSEYDYYKNDIDTTLEFLSYMISNIRYLNYNEESVKN